MWAALFAREARGVALLPCAQAYFPEVQASLERIAAATAKLRAPGFTGTLRVCATPSLTMKWLIPRLSCFQALHPGIDVQLTTQGRSSWTGAATPAATCCCAMATWRMPS